MWPRHWLGSQADVLRRSEVQQGLLEGLADRATGDLDQQFELLFDPVLVHARKRSRDVP